MGELMAATVPLNAIQSDRAAGVLLGAACGDALGVPYEFQPPLAVGEQPEMRGGGLGPYAPGEYSDDTQMAMCIAEVSATGADLRSGDALDRIAGNFLRWKREGATDIGAQTRQVLDAVSRLSGSGVAAAMRDAAAEVHRRTGRSAGNGSLMRTAPVALAFLGQPEALAEAARAVSELTHHDPLTADACVLWCAGIRRAVLDGTFDGVREGLDLLPAERRDRWSSWLAEAESKPPEQFRPNGFVVAALQAAWSAITHTDVPDHNPARGSFACQHLERALAAAVRVGDDTDTVAAIAGALLGARWGSSAVPLAWQRVVHGWPNKRAADLISLAVLTAQGGQAGQGGWPGCARAPRPAVAPLMLAHPRDPGVILGNLHTDPAAARASAVVSLCRVGCDDFDDVAVGNRGSAWLVDQPGANAQPHFVVDQAARMVLELRKEGHVVLLHCAAGQSRTPAVAARYTTLTTGIPARSALAELRGLLRAHGWTVNPELRQVVEQL
ncbi:ADP-ribosylglycohydrolase family protein [Micromonospora sp. IBSANI012]|uniref:ADP-ribosylglycohydrolase family protein n=1 Tax=Micromonospora sp. IBSANI012 TaxID=3457761 RepID=UPI00405A1677